MDKNKNKKILIKIKLLFFVIILTLSFICTIKFLDKVNLDVDDLFLTTLVSSSTNINKEGISSDIVNYVIDLDFFSPVNLLKNNYRGLINETNYKEEEKENIVMQPTLKPTPNIKIEPIVYIFNTHQTEEYTFNNLAVYNIKPTVMTASYMLQEKLKKNEIYSIVEEESVQEILSNNNWNYASSYKATRMLLEQAKYNNPSLIYYIDLHRDSVSKDKTTAIINGKSYAKVMFLLGMDNANYKESEKVITRLNNIISEKYNGISRGIYKKGGKGVNGIYNQDFSSNCILIEVGGVDNTIEEVSNTIDAISDMLITYIGENNG